MILLWESNLNKLRFIGEIEFANWQRNGNGRLIASPTSNIYPITVGEDIILPQNVRKTCDLWIDLTDKSKFESRFRGENDIF